MRKWHEMQAEEKATLLDELCEMSIEALLEKICKESGIPRWFYEDQILKGAGIPDLNGIEDTPEFPFILEWLVAKAISMVIERPWFHVSQAVLLQDPVGCRVNVVTISYRFERHVVIDDDAAKKYHVDETHSIRAEWENDEKLKTLDRALTGEEVKNHVLELQVISLLKEWMDDLMPEPGHVPPPEVYSYICKDVREAITEIR